VRSGHVKRLGRVSKGGNHKVDVVLVQGPSGGIPGEKRAASSSPADAQRGKTASSNWKMLRKRTFSTGGGGPFFLLPRRKPRKKKGRTISKTKPRGSTG